MENIDNRKCSLQQAHQIIQENIHSRPPEKVGLATAHNRFAFNDIVAEEPVPAFAESTRDGYVLASGDGGSGTRRYKIVDEIAAGRVHQVGRLVPGTACRIMTGGCVPEGSERVVPYEQCIERVGEVFVEERLLHAWESFVRKAGSHISRGQRLVHGGIRLQAEHLELLSSCGIQSVAVAGKPAVGYFCTGSELKYSAAGLKNGQKVSSNSFLLDGILTSFGAASRNLGIVGDTLPELSKVFAEARKWDVEVIISTGGMGPGKYDLVEKAFVDAGGEVYFNALTVRPGKAVLFGSLGRTLFFGLPGPPYAVRTLLHALVGPLLLAMQGAKKPGPKRLQAYLLHPVEVKHHDVLHLKDGVLVLSDGKCSARFADQLETVNCHILLQPGCACYPEGELVDVHLVGDLSASL